MTDRAKKKKNVKYSSMIYTLTVAMVIELRSVKSFFPIRE